jgi:hypothetical protein
LRREKAAGNISSGLLGSKIPWKVENLLRPGSAPVLCSLFPVEGRSLETPTCTGAKDFASILLLGTPFEVQSAACSPLIGYAASVRKVLHRMGYCVKKILDGANPGDLPGEQPTKLELIINLKTAKTLGIEIPPTLLGRADWVIE